MLEVKTKHLYVVVNGSYVHVIQYGDDERIIKFSGQPSDEGELAKQKLGAESSCIRLVIFLPGNPGVLGVYHDYLVSLYRSLCNKITNPSERPIVLAIGHNNIELPNEEDEKLIIETRTLDLIEQSIAKSHGPNDVELQVLNKLLVLKRVLNCNLEDCQLVFVGHSIGCYIILRLLQDNLVASSHSGTVLIHPALENLALTEKGRYFDRVFSYKGDYVVRAFIYLFETFLPKSIRIRLTRRFACSPELVEASSETVIESLAQLSCAHTVKALIDMAKSEFKTVKNIDHQKLVKPHAENLRLIYAETDHWVNRENRDLLREAYPNLYIEEQPTMHAFIMDPKTVYNYSEKVADFVLEFYA